MAKTSTDARRHIREIEKLFASFEAVSRTATEEVMKRSVKRKYLKQSFRRLIEKGFIEDTGEEYKLTLKGMRFFRKTSGKNPSSVPDKVWDGRWRLVTFDVPCKFDDKRREIRSLLKEFDFYQLQKSVWICPASLSKKFWEIMVDGDLNGYCKTMVVDVLEGDEDLKKHFRIT
jgi:DNA-binding transcriptional regulator PaaX